MINATLFHDTLNTLRVYTGQNAHPYFGNVRNKGVMPPAKYGNGTIKADVYAIRGTGTSFKDGRIKNNDFLWDGQAAVRRVIDIQSDDLLFIDKPFPGAVSALSVYYIPRGSYRMIYAKSIGTVAAILQESQFGVGNTLLNGGSPLGYDASAAGAQIEFQIEE